MRTPHETYHKAPLKSPRREFLTRSTLWLVGVVAASTVGTSRLFAKETGKPERRDEPDSFQVFDCHLPCRKRRKMAVVQGYQQF